MDTKEKALVNAYGDQVRARIDAEWRGGGDAQVRAKRLSAILMEAREELGSWSQGWALVVRWTLGHVLTEFGLETGTALVMRLTYDIELRLRMEARGERPPSQMNAYRPADADSD